MIIVIPSTGDTINSLVSDTLGRAPFLIVYDTVKEEYNSIENPGFKVQDGSGLKASEIIINQRADILLTREIGRKSYSVLQKERIQIQLLTSGGSVKSALKKFLKKQEK